MSTASASTLGLSISAVIALILVFVLVKLFVKVIALIIAIALGVAAWQVYAHRSSHSGAGWRPASITRSIG